ncbi:DUF1304 family protein [Staphylococcus sp. GSSP0090]|nr:DUF1304 family protein [Staphylococcus sp. GSSP0090]
MSTLSFILTLLVAIEFLYILVLQTFLTTSKKTSQLFKIEQHVLQQDKLKTLMKNQGVYNGLLGVLLLYGLFFSDHPKELIIGILIYMILVALYGAITSQKSILLKQGGLPILALISFMF